MASIWLAVIGVAILGLYGVIPTLQPAHFGQVDAAYGSVFVALPILWGWLVDRISPDKFDLLGGWIVLLGVLVIMYASRGYPQ